MHVVIIWQLDPEVQQILQPLIDQGADNGVVPIAGHHVRLHKMLSKSTLKGAWIQRLGILSAIVGTATHALNQPTRLAEMTVIFIFHQTSTAAVDAIMAALRALEPDVLDRMAASAQKDLAVRTAVLLSCESGTDQVAPQPVPPVLQKWVAQARDMRASTLRAFTIQGVLNPGVYVPNVITFSTGNPETGGVVLNPWNAEFQSLHGHFTANGGWEYDEDSNGQPDQTSDPSTGTVYSDNGQPGGATTTPVPAGTGANFMPFNPSDIP